MVWLDESASARRIRASALDPAVAEIAEVLHEMGGSAHQDAVIDRIAVRRGEVLISDELRADVLAAFEAHRAHARRRRKPALLCLPFGEGSRRWGLTPEGWPAPPTMPPAVASIAGASREAALA
jgi:hypothetical protein